MNRPYADVIMAQRENAGETAVCGSGLQTIRPIPKPGGGRPVRRDAAILAYRTRYKPDEILYREFADIRAACTEADKLTRDKIADPEQIVALTVKELFNRWFDDAQRPEPPRPARLIPSGDYLGPDGRYAA